MEKLSVVIVLLLLSACSDSYLNESQIRQLVTGNTTHGHHLKKGYRLKTWWGANGMLEGYQDNRFRRGEWWIDKKGRQCVEWQGAKKKFCRYVKDNGDGSYTKYKTNKNKKLVAIVKWRKIYKGKQF